MNTETNSNASNLLTISSVVSEKLTEGTMQIVARWKESKDRIVSSANRNRCIILPANMWSDSLECNVKESTEDVNKHLRLHLLDSIEELAKKYLSTICEESNMQRTQVPLNHFSLQSLLQWQSELAALSGRLNSEEIKSWVASSATVKAITTSHGEKIGTALGEQFVKLASPNHGLTPEKAAKILATLWNVEDTESTTGLRVQMRLTSISKKSEQTQNVLDSIL